MQEARTSLDPTAVLNEARVFFTRNNSIYAAFLEKESSRHMVFRGQGGEEIIVAVEPADGGSRVTASTYMFDQQVARFLSTLRPTASEAAS